MLGGWGGGGGDFPLFASLFSFPSETPNTQAIKDITEFPYPGRYFDPMILLSQPNKNRNSFYKFHKKYPNRTSL